jgi:hypothetical protein
MVLRHFVDELSEQLKPFNERFDELASKLKPLIDVTFCIEPAGSAVSSWSPEWKPSLVSFFGLSDCMVLSSFLASGKISGLWPSPSRAVVGEHIFPNERAKAGLARTCDIDVGSPRNGLLLLKCIEEEYGNGHVMILPQGDLPGGAVILKLWVASTIGHRVLWDSSAEFGRQHVVVQQGTPSWRELVFADLHGHEFQVRPRPFMRSLFMKADMAHKQHPDEFPQPLQHAAAFESGCDKMHLLMRALK